MKEVDDDSFAAWKAEVDRLSPPNIGDHLPGEPPPGYFDDMWRAIFAGGFTPEEATAGARIDAWLDKVDRDTEARLPPRLRNVNP